MEGEGEGDVGSCGATRTVNDSYCNCSLRCLELECHVDEQRGSSR